MKLTVHAYSSDFEVDVQPTDTMQSLKKIIERRVSICENEQVLICNAQILSDNNKVGDLSSNGITKGISVIRVLKH